MQYRPNQPAAPSFGREYTTVGPPEQTGVQAGWQPQQGAFAGVRQPDATGCPNLQPHGGNEKIMGQTAKAIRYYEMALTLDGSIEFARENLARLKGQNA